MKEQVLLMNSDENRYYHAKSFEHLFSHFLVIYLFNLFIYFVYDTGKQLKVQPMAHAHISWDIAELTHGEAFQSLLLWGLLRINLSTILDGCIHNCIMF